MPSAFWSYVTAAIDLPSPSIRPDDFSCDTFTASRSAVPAFTFDSVVPVLPASVTLSFDVLSYTTASDSPVFSSMTPPSVSASFRLPRFSFVANSCEPFTASVLVADSSAAFTFVSFVPVLPASVTDSWFGVPSVFLSYVTAASALPSSPTRPDDFSCDTFTASVSALPAATFDSVVPPAPASVADL